ncbi:MAG: nucleotidyltransferase domain-containing protein [Sulfuricurvum sp.]|jgi:predicted nucleotidyltransferase|uniref:nucleotidyltransferase domain-containing protein n=1 Tax=Sulfuricurvum sp. TaxID=2025608 RepID=UPI00262F27F7|nr:nucleotidyltransferase domain-containing protein [Sulfuricurvum sp.]MDD2369296.1 nucleotidyltransferase domain-containing protein [Sulfuricurvum sp.]MDD2950174.1 nucleotidyltransferase domain-containing protein [Sulfuricurvum sp.]MDD5118843.1 nucleotidyltransferase domain-containing protein [Sulfuricurvum sp.]
MVDIEVIKHEIVERLKTLDPDKIILFGSYAYGNPREDSDIDLFLVKDTEDRNFEAVAMKKITDLIYKYKIGFDLLSAPANFINEREDYFYKVDILQKGKVLYERNVS